MKRLIIIITTLVLGMALLTSCARKPEKVRIGYIPHMSGLPFFVALEKGYFKEEGLDVEFVKCGYREYMDALLTGRVDIIAPTSFPSLFGIEVESPGLLKFFLPGGEKKDGDIIYGILVRKDSPMKTMEELKGKKIGVTDPITTVNLKLILKKIGLDPDRDVTIMQVDPSVAITALVSKQVDAFLLTQPDLAVAMQKGETRLLETNPRSKYIIDPYWSGAAATTAKFIEENPQKMRRLFKALDKAVDFIRANPYEAKSLLVKYTPLTSDIAQKTGMYFLSKSTEPVDLQTIQFLAHLLFEHGILKKEVNADKMYVDYSRIK